MSDEPLLLSAADAARALGISERHLYDLLDEGALPEVRLGRRRLVPRRALDLLVERAMTGFDPAALADRIAAHSAAA
ncbi:MAG TPA: helix-turn-helix domain-containing protein [Acidimicrobiales bacterium]|nr:helix-turn-helix domain-containing protein [Acidimicrobiales bacterium]